MRNKPKPTSPVREEVLNVVLADLLSERDLVSVPESILRSKSGGRRKLPDVTIGDLWGVRIIVEGRIEDNTGVRSTLFRDAQKRVAEGIAPICLAVLYPPDLRYISSVSKLGSSLISSTLTVRVISEGSEGNWAETTVDEMTDILRRSYELLVSEDVVSTSVTELEYAIEQATGVISAASATPVRIRQRLGIPEQKIEKGVHLDDEDEVS